VFAGLDTRGPRGALLTQALGAGATLLYSGVMTVAILWVIDVVVGLRVARRHEVDGLDLSLHGERVE
jgi:Amt family ammonium transporter